MHENRETSEALAAQPGRRSAGEGLGHTARMYVSEESHSGIVPMNHSNKDGASLAESEEGMPAGVSGCIQVPSRIRVSLTVMENRLLSRVEPVYPPQAQAEHIAGVVVARIVIDKSGGVLNADYVSGPTVLVPAAIEAAKQWKYQPYLLNGELVEVETTVEISFTL
jgi:TonB family protein